MANTMADQSKKNNKAAIIIIALGFIALQLAAYFISSAPMTVLHTSPGFWTFPVLAFLWTVFVIISLASGSDLLEDNKWPYIVLIALAFASAVCIGYVPTGLSV